MKAIDQNLHKYPAVIRYKFLELLGIKQKTTEAPDERFRLNLVEHFRDENREELKKRTEELISLPASEGNVVYAAARPYKLTSGKRPYMNLKYHVSTIFTATVLNSLETKTKGVYNLEYGVLAGSRSIKEKDARTVDGKKAVHVGKSFSTKENPDKGTGILIEAETINITYDVKSKTFDLSAWAPRMLGVTDKKPQTLDEIERQALKDHVFQAKIIDKDGKIHYLPGKSGEEVASKSSEWNDYTLLFYSDQVEEIKEVLTQAGINVVSPPQYGNAICIRCGLKTDEDRWGVCFACAMLEDPESSDDEFLSGIEDLKERGYTVKDWLEGRDKTMTKPLRDGYKVNPKVIERLRKEG